MSLVAGLFVISDGDEDWSVPSDELTEAEAVDEEDGLDEDEEFDVGGSE